VNEAKTVDEVQDLTKQVLRLFGSANAGPDRVVMTCVAVLTVMVQTGLLDDTPKVKQPVEDFLAAFQAQH
jgi:hypothetical protein